MEEITRKPAVLADVLPVLNQFREAFLRRPLEFQTAAIDSNIRRLRDKPKETA